MTPRPTKRRRPTRRSRATPDPAPDLHQPPLESTADLDLDGLAAEETGPQRRCIVSRQQGERAAMLRFVVGPDNVIVPDLAARLPGRGIWLSARADVINGPRTRQAFSRAARARVAVPDDLALRIVAGLETRIRDLLGLARRAGQAVAGYQKAHEWLAGGRAALIIQARDGSREERDRFIGASTVPVIAPLPAHLLGTVFGRQTSVHVAVAAGKLAGSLQTEAGRLAGVMAPGGGTVETTGFGTAAAVRDEDADIDD